MAVAIVQANYEDLAQIAARWHQQHETSEALDRRLKAALQPLEQGGWIGLGAAAFFSEMRGEVLPAIARLSAALEIAQSVTLEIREQMRQAEEDAANPFKTKGEHGPDAGSGGGGGKGDGGGGGGGGGGDGKGGGGDDKKGLPSWDTTKGKFTFLQYDAKKGGWNNPSELGFRYAVKEDAFGKLGRDPNDHWKIDAGAYEGGFGADGSLVGGYLGISGIKAETEGIIGDENLGLVGDATLKVASGEVLAGWDLEKRRFGVNAGFTVASVEGEVSANVAGVNVGVTGEVGLKFEVGLAWDNGPQVKLPFFSLGFSFGKAKDGKVD